MPPPDFNVELLGMYDSYFPEVKHSYQYISLHENWIEHRPTLRVNKNLQCSFDGSVWHGSAVYTKTEEGGRWEMKSHYRAEHDKMKTVVFDELPLTASFLHLNKQDEGCNALLTPTVSE